MARANHKPLLLFQAPPPWLAFSVDASAGGLLLNAHGFKRRCDWRFVLAQALMPYIQAHTALSAVLIGGFVLAQARMHYFQTPMGSSGALIGGFVLAQLAHWRCRLYIRGNRAYYIGRA